MDARSSLSCNGLSPHYGFRKRVGSPYRGHLGSRVSATGIGESSRRERHGPIIPAIDCTSGKLRLRSSGHTNSCMTTDRQMARMYADQEEVIALLNMMGDFDLANRLERCAAVRRVRHHAGWPRVCRTAACVWCRRPTMRSWWLGMCQWTAEATTWSLAAIPLHLSASLLHAVRRLRRALRDVRDRAARRRRRWREVCCAGMVGGDHGALVMITHEGIERREVQDVLHHRWPGVLVKSLEDEEPSVAMSPADAADLGRCRLGLTTTLGRADPC